MKYNKYFVLIPSFFFIPFTSAHCPLCTAGAVLAAGSAAWLGVKTIVIGIFIGAFAVSIGAWISNILKKQYLPFQKWILILVSYLTTVLPMIPLIGSTSSVYVPWAGEYGMTYIFDVFLIGSIVGGIILLISPSISKLVTRMRRGETIPFQGILITFLLLFIIGIALQVI